MIGMIGEKIYEIKFAEVKKVVVAYEEFEEEVKKIREKIEELEEKIKEISAEQTIKQLLDILQKLHELEKSLEFHEIVDYTVAEKFLYEYFIDEIYKNAKLSLDIAYFNEDMFDIVLDLDKDLDYLNKLRVIEDEDRVVLELYIECDSEVRIAEYNKEEFYDFIKVSLDKLEEYVRELEITYKVELFDKLLDSFE